MIQLSQKKIVSYNNLSQPTADDDDLSDFLVLLISDKDKIY